MQYIKAPFNFVPVSEKVFFPGWADQISHDMPFSDGLTGQLTIELEAKTPIFVRDSSCKEEFCHVKVGTSKKYFIPGTSLKGTIRNVLEILSFSKMDKINDDKYAIRDLNNELLYTLLGDSENIHCGWLSLNTDENNVQTASIEDCDIPWRISHEQLDNQLDTKFVPTFMKFGQAFKEDDKGTVFINSDYKTAAYKYSLLPLAKRNGHFTKDKTELNKQLCNFSESANDLKGDIVLTGQASASKNYDNHGNSEPGPSGKFYEFVFIEQANPKIRNIDARTWRDFKFHYLDHDTKHISADWEWRRKQLADGEKIPVFFRLIKDELLQDTDDVLDLGLAYLYKMPYKYSVKQLLKGDHQPGLFLPDLAECIFGYVHDQDALKGRVHFSPGWADQASPDNLKNTVLGSPKASYYPIYIKQEDKDGKIGIKDNQIDYMTYMDSKSELAGWKRYPVCENVSSEMPIGTTKMSVRYRPLKANAKFTAQVNYFNLRPVELGALLSALTFHNNSTNCYHGLGMAKSYGFGRVSLKITEGLEVKDLKKYLAAFETEVEAYLKVSNSDFVWHNSLQINELITMAKIHNPSDEQDQIDYHDRMGYMKLADYSKAKSEWDETNSRNGFILEKYSKIVKNSEPITSFCEISEVDSKQNVLEPFIKEQISKRNLWKIETDKLQTERKERKLLQAEERKTLNEKEAIDREIDEKIKKEQTIKEAKLSIENNNNKFDGPLELGSELKALVGEDCKTVWISCLEIESIVQLVRTMEQKGKELSPNVVIDVKVKLLKKDGSISQVGWVDNKK